MAVNRGRRERPDHPRLARLSRRLAPLIVGGAVIAASPAPALADPGAGRPALGAGAPIELTDGPSTDRTSLDSGADLYVAAAEPLPESALAALTDHPDVTGVATVDAARLMVQGRETAVVGVPPERLTAWGAAALEDAQTDGVLLTAQYAAAHGIGPDTVVSARGRLDLDLDVAGFATAALPGTDAVVSAETAVALGLPSGNAALVTAPESDAYALRDELLELLPEGIGVQVLPMAGAPVTVVGERPEPTAASDGPWPSLGRERVETAIAAAESRLGLPYVWGGSGPNVFDCSGLVQWSFQQAGVRLPRVTHDQWNTGARISYEEALRGDLIFWRSDPNRPGYISHVAIYLGEGMMLEAPRSGDVVKITEVRLGNLAGFVRITPAATP